jgi:site-specific DNA-methyltransferase (adenine-specific)
VKPYYEQDGITIYHGDCREVSCELAADAMLTDPPYGVGKASWDNGSVLPPPVNGVRSIGLMPGVRNLLRCPPMLHGLEYKWTLVAHLTNGMTRGDIGYGNWIACVLYAENGLSLYEQGGDVKRFAVGRDPKPSHPSPKPRAPCEWFLGRLPGDVIVDPFCGSGTTLLAALNAGRKAIGIEIDEGYCEIAARRLDQTVLALGSTALPKEG